MQRFGFDENAAPEEQLIPVKRRSLCKRLLSYGVIALTLGAVVFDITTDAIFLVSTVKPTVDYASSLECTSTFLYANQTDVAEACNYIDGGGSLSFPTVDELNDILRFRRKGLIATRISAWIVFVISVVIAINLAIMIFADCSELTESENEAAQDSEGNSSKKSAKTTFFRTVLFLKAAVMLLEDFPQATILGLFFVSENRVACAACACTQRNIDGELCTFNDVSVTLENNQDAFLSMVGSFFAPLVGTYITLRSLKDEELGPFFSALLALGAASFVNLVPHAAFLLASIPTDTAFHVFNILAPSLFGVGFIIVTIVGSR